MSYNVYLDECVNILYTEAAKKWTWHEFAKKSGVSYRTIYRLGMRITESPHLRTVYLLARSLGMELPNINKLRLRVSYYFQHM